MENLKLFLPILLLCCLPFVAQGAFYPQDSSWQKVLECESIRSGKITTFKKGNYVIIRKKGYSRKTRGRIQGFLDNQIIIKGKKIDINDIQTIRKRSLLLKTIRFLTISLVVLFIIAIVLGLLLIAALSIFILGLFIIFFLFEAAIILFFVFAITISILLLASLLIRKSKTINLNKWRARITSRLMKR